MSAPIDSGQGLTDSGNGGISTDSGQSVDASSLAATQQQTQADNPAWAPFLQDVPNMFHDKIRGHLRGYDDNYRKLETQYREAQERYKPYERYLSVDPGAIHYSLGLLQQIQQNPQAVYEALAEHLKQQGININGQANPQDDPVDISVDPKFAELDRRQREIDERQAAFDEFIAKQEEERLTAQYEQDINAQIQQIQKQFGNAVDVQDLLDRMLMQVHRGEELNAARAFEDQKTSFQRMYGNMQNTRQAPNVLSPNGTIAPSGSQKKPEDMNESERKAYFKQLLDAANAGG